MEILLEIAILNHQLAFLFEKTRNVQACISINGIQEEARRYDIIHIICDCI